jgi:hypothetical protein
VVVYEKIQIRDVNLIIVIKILMEATNGLGVILEDRYYAKSFPFGGSSTDNLRFNTMEQCMSISEPQRYKMLTHWQLLRISLTSRSMRPFLECKATSL